MANAPHTLAKYPDGPEATPCSPRRAPPPSSVAVGGGRGTQEAFGKDDLNVIDEPVSSNFQGHKPAPGIRSGWDGVKDIVGVMRAGRGANAPRPGTDPASGWGES
jgi:hypothetical protein